jgi:hypothetical protein
LYLPPGLKIEETDLSELFIKQNTFILGYFNAKNPLWGSPCCDYRGKIIEKLLADYNFICLNTGEGTRINISNGSLSHLDLALCGANFGHLSSWSVLNDSFGSDHYPALITYSDNIMTEPYPEPSWNISKANWIDFTNALNDMATFSPLVVDPLDVLSIAILEVANAFIPKKKTCQSTRMLPYWNTDCSSSINKRREAEKVMKKCRTIGNIFAFRKSKAFVQFTLRKAKFHFWHSYVSGFQSIRN